MPVILSSRRDKEEQVSFLRRILQHFVFHAATPDQRHQILQHLLNLAASSDDLIVGAKLEIDEAIGVTRITLETALAGKKAPIV